MSSLNSGRSSTSHDGTSTTSRWASVSSSIDVEMSDGKAFVAKILSVWSTESFSNSTESVTTIMGNCVLSLSGSKLEEQMSVTNGELDWQSWFDISGESDNKDSSELFIVRDFSIKGDPSLHICDSEYNHEGLVELVEFNTLSVDGPGLSLSGSLANLSTSLCSLECSNNKSKQ
ncbi:hypothetical protein GDO78_002244 [Eleutherodactylus coqui]|uniref:Uncharacterized protein n=1 Tax=Eleutherodactylus coqui TaxID=57060 RepID=A0A8J6EXM5_ELECQ|nr:hypothetical protein GDO78_002244 [Eleutherodactylus coqui]